MTFQGFDNDDLVVENLTPGNPLETQYGGTGSITTTGAFDNLSPTTTKGDLIVSNGSSNVRIAVGTDGQALVADSLSATGVSWGSSGTSSPLTTKGDLYGYDTSNARIPVGADGFVLTADSAESLGVKWAAVAGTGDVVGPASATDNALARFDGATGKLIQNSTATLSDAGALEAGSLSLTTDLSVANGGTGVSSFTAYSVVCGGTTGAGALQNVSGLGSSGQVLTSNGAGALPTWQAGGTGDVTAAANLTDNTIIRGDGGAKGVQDSGITIDDTDNVSGMASLTMATGGGVRTATTATNTLLLQAYDVDGASYTTFGTLTANNTPTFDLSTATTIGGNAFYYVGGTDVAVADGGTGASDASGARTNLGLVIGTNVQAWDAGLDDIAGLAVTDGNIIVGNGANWVAESGATARTSLGLGSIATQAASSVSITGGSITGITDLVVGDGGTGVSSFTAYSVVCGGTTSGGSLQNVSGLGTSGQVLTSNGAGALPTWQAGGGGGSMPPKEYWFAAESLQPLETNFAPLEKLVGTTVNVMVRSFDDTTEEYVNGKLQVPGDVDTSGTVTFRAYVMAKTAAASKNIALTFGHVAINDSEDFDVAYTDEDSGDIAIDATQDDVTEATWTETVTNLGWAANDLVIFRISRPQASANNLSGDMYMMSLAVEIPRA